MHDLLLEGRRKLQLLPRKGLSYHSLVLPIKYKLVATLNLSAGGCGSSNETLGNWDDVPYNLLLIGFIPS